MVENAIVTAESSKRAASIIGLVGLLWGGLAVVGAMLAAFNAAWQVLGRGLLDRAFALALVHRGGIAVPGHRRCSARRSAGCPACWCPPTSLVGLVLTTVLFCWTYSTLGNNTVGWRVHLPGALVVARRLRDPQGRRRRVPAPPDRRVLRPLRLDRRGVRDCSPGWRSTRASSSTGRRSTSCATKRGPAP